MTVDLSKIFPQVTGTAVLQGLGFRLDPTGFRIYSTRLFWGFPQLGHERKLDFTFGFSFAISARPLPCA